MQNYCKTIGALAAASALVAGNAKAEVEYELHTGYSSEYLFRGVDLGDNLVEVGLDAAYKVDKFTLSGGVWATAFQSSNSVYVGPYGTANTGTGNQTDNEVDLYTEGSYDFGFMTASVGYIYYWNAGRLGVDNQEVYFAVGHDFGFANLSLTYYWNLKDGGDGNNQGYTELAASHSWELSPCLKLNYSSNLGFLAEEGVCTAWTNKLSLDWGFSENAKVSPFVAHSIGLGDEAGTIWYQTDNEFVAGSMLSVNF